MNDDAYKAVAKITKLNFKRYIKNSGIVITELLEAKSLSHDREFFILCYDEDNESKSFRFKERKAFISLLMGIAIKRKNKNEWKLKGLMAINDSESVDFDYHQAMEMNAINQESLEGLIDYLKKASTQL